MSAQDIGAATALWYPRTAGDTAAVWLALLILVSAYVVLRQVGVSDGGAGFWAPAAAAVVALLQVWRGARDGEAPSVQRLRRAAFARRVLTLAILTYLGTSLVAGAVGGFVPVIPPGGSPDHAIAVGVRLATTVGLPVSLILIGGLGRLSATWLTVRRPFRWLGLISAVPALVSLALHPIAVAFSANHGTTPPRGLAETAPRTAVVTVLIFCALALGNLNGRASLRRRAARTDGAHLRSPGAVDAGEATGPNARPS
ncbi:hypothetical protein GCE86_10580 [Micromonospora terminaliae]|uniref:Uncharacterized protein n=1 Tax=Micromonospora terminaliae TaxID=1914461 RepID=A0AAJ3DII0_9ACTN|nr:hypothetical protein [Micromonospora terminaliae]NES27782.1 hypothetical protein [Micromonospora terminaliae]QGL47435.1 hypothetical protein GCE86_10580 [Micromonospora terminaliae]